MLLISMAAHCSVRGYIYKFPFLDEEALGLDFGDMRRFVAPLYQHVMHAKYDSLLAEVSSWMMS